MINSNDLKNEAISDLKLKFFGALMAFKYLSEDLNAFQTPSLKDELKKLKSDYNEKICLIKKQENDIINLKKQLMEIKDEYELNTNLFVDKLNKLNSSIVEYKNDNIRLQSNDDELRVENEKFKEHINSLEMRLKEKIIEIEKLSNCDKNLIDEINSLKIALEIKNNDLSELRNKYNSLYNKNEYYNEIDLKLKKYMHDVENLKEILKNKHQYEQNINEQNRILAMKVEKKNRENQRLSMQNEELQFRLISQPNLSTCILDSIEKKKEEKYIENEYLEENEQVQINNTLVTLRRKPKTKSSFIPHSAQLPFNTSDRCLRPISADYSLKTENCVLEDLKIPLFNDYAFEKKTDRSSYLFLSMFYENEEELVAAATSKSFEFNSNDDLMSKSEPCINFNSSFTISDLENDNSENNIISEDN